MTDLNRHLTSHHLAELRAIADKANYVVILKRNEMLALLDAADAAPEMIRQAKEEAWDEGAHTAWERSTPEVNGARYHWRSDGEPVNPYEADAGAERGHDETRLDLEPIKARVAAATDGPWSGVKDGTYRVFTPSGQIVAYSMNAANREFVQHAREDVPALITEIESLRATIKRKEQP